MAGTKQEIRYDFGVGIELLTERRKEALSDLEWVNDRRNRNSTTVRKNITGRRVPICSPPAFQRRGPRTLPRRPLRLEPP